MADEIIIKPDGSWEFKGEDSRLSHGREDKQVTGQRIFNRLTGHFEYQTLDRVYCMNCGAEGGLSARTTVYIRYYCTPCFERLKPTDFVPMLPDEEVAYRNGLEWTGN